MIFWTERRRTAMVEKRTKVTGAERVKLATELSAAYHGGASIRTLAESTGRSYGFVHRLLTESGVTLRTRGGAPRAKRAA
ncbi:helix-turn-helix domain-containing protein [Streptomyces sp. NPDC046977]|uniref:helix-turn-helix domain-containing protein n=1 Tax=Streptomyces sp. NPDC046977 TaxID=3154703 RepID=UPI0033E93E5E